jgi:hypothetical protein
MTYFIYYYAECGYAGCLYAECRYADIVMLSYVAPHKKSRRGERQAKYYGAMTMSHPVEI